MNLNVKFSLIPILISIPLPTSQPHPALANYQSIRIRSVAHVRPLNALEVNLVTPLRYRTMISYLVFQPLALFIVVNKK
jgi:hypothetical protein